MTLLTQAELELETYAFGRERIRAAIERNEDKGGAGNNPYAQSVYRRFVLPLAELVKEDVETPRVGRAQAHVPLLRDMDFEAVAFVAVRAALCSMMQGLPGRAIIAEVGRSVYHEKLLTEFADASPTLFYHLMNDMDRRLSTNEAHRMTVFKMQARKNNIPFNEWGSGQRDQVGSYLLDLLAGMGMVQIELVNVQKKTGGRTRTESDTIIRLSPEIETLVQQVSDFIVESTPYFLPCVEPPKDWTEVDDGGFHTTEMRRLSPWMVKAYGASRDDYRSAELRHEMAAVNKLQKVKWRINRRMLDAVSNIAKHFDIEEIISQAESPRPHKPEWLDGSMKKENMTDAQKKEFQKWKRETAEWYTSEKLRGTKGKRFYNAVRVARQFVDYPELYFVYFVDFRGRKYVQTTGVSPQGSDLQKALLEFGEGKPLLTQSAKDWFCITGANRWGYDKVSLRDRVRWVEEHHEQILAFAQSPVDHPEWKEADKPLQFLAWCMEYADWQVFGDKFQSRIAVGMDGSCNGLQNFSAMLRDEVGGIATNLVPSDLPSDIYAMVAERLRVILEGEDPDEDGYRDLWLSHGLSRGLVKRSVMTLPYGSRRSSWAEFIVKDYMREGLMPELEKERYERAARFLSKRLEAAITDVVVAAAGAMEWLQKASGAILRNGYDRIKWITPSGFPVSQVYWEQDQHRINTKLCGNAKLSFRRETDDPKKSRHRNGIAPNFVHSLDASHLTLVVNEAARRGIDSFAMIHDDFGTHAADAAEMYKVIRETFVQMYERHDVLEEFRAAYSFLPEPPPMGRLDLSQVLNSPFFFS